MPEKIRELSIVFFALAIGGLLCAGCSQQASLEKKLAFTKKGDIDHLAEEAKKLPKEDTLVLVSERLSAAFDEIKRTNNPLKKPYLVAVLLRHHVPDETVDQEATLLIHIEWFENRFISRSVRLTNTDTMESWTYNFQSDHHNRANAAIPGIRFFHTYQFGNQAPGTKLVTFEEGISFVEMARVGKLKAALVDEGGQILSNEVLVDFRERHFSIDDLPAKNGADSTGNQSDGLAPAAL